jgi:hypothetical protein
MWRWMRLSGSVELLEEKTKIYGVIGVNLKEGRRGRWEDNIKIDFEETG